MFSEEIFNSLHQCDQTIDKDKNNNSTITAKAKPKCVEKYPMKSNENNPMNAVKMTEPKSEIYSSGTLKRKRDAKSPSAKPTLESPTSDATSRKQSQTTATILVSKSKTKTGLPLLLKK